MNKLKVIIGPEILKRTFEGQNNDPVTSEYSKSKRWVIRYKIPNYHNFVHELFTTKREAKLSLDLKADRCNVVFNKVDELYGCINAEELFDQHDDIIFYADGGAGPVLRSIEDEEFNVSEFEYYLFDGWCIAVWKK